MTTLGPKDDIIIHLSPQRFFLTLKKGHINLKRLCFLKSFAIFDISLPNITLSMVMVVDINNIV